jgi:hypothetical protein
MPTIPAQPVPDSVSTGHLPRCFSIQPPARRLSVTVTRLAILFLLLANVSPSKAQGASFWSKQERISEYYQQTEEPPYLIADRNHTVHAFNAQPLDLNTAEAPKAIFYRQWTIENGWTYPNDILYDSDGFGWNLVGLTGDEAGHVHLIMQKNGGLYYVQNYLSLAQAAVSWPAPAFIAGSINSFGPGNELVSAIAVNPEGNQIVIVFAGQQYGNGLYFTSSSDGGVSWTDPYPIYLTGDETIIVTDPKLHFGESGTIHAVWGTFLETGFGGPGFYANFDLEDQTWSEPLALDIPGIRTPSVIETQGMVFVGYHHINVNGNWWRKSLDGGKTWSFPEQFSSRHVGTNGAVSFVVDGANVLHAFFGERMNDQNHGVWHLTYTGTTWSNMEAVVRGPQVKGPIGGNGFDPRSARAVIVNGNVALVTWGTDGFGGVNGAWYSFQRLDAPELETIVLAAPTRMPSIALTSEPLDIASATAVNTLNQLDISSDPPAAASDPQISILAGVIPALLTLVGLVVLYAVVQNRNK